MKKINQIPVSLGVWCRKHVCFYVDPIWVSSHNQSFCPKCREEEKEEDKKRY